MSRLNSLFARSRVAGRPALIPFITAGDPDIKTTRRLVLELEKRGADIIELGVPFSDPLADGPTIQASSKRALDNGTRMKVILQLVKNLRGETQIPLVLMSYYNPIYQYGLEKFSKDAVGAGVDGVIISDLPPEEAVDWKKAAAGFGLDTIFLAAPTSTEERIGTIIASSSGFIYYVSVTGITGARTALPSGVLSSLKRIKQKTKKPVVVGFGISTPEQVRRLSQWADGIIVGSALVRIIEKNIGKPTLISAAGDFMASLSSKAVGCRL
ncbi:tryptophan synthase subunit alpha [candidate division NPL-UPA2 bacterium Unc8]|uniref:Tryptophan synthase alpha chain n=1 Tax=candidate division NPL-UPA2 bacterium Unc8 TaxID=1980939 RepID=A0A399FUC5_UNCN2|nr:Tryptophan synthase alpha chain [Bacillota bacterium]MBT9138336.1 Tryptophan synthase alpha chain [Bacillota bacterium]RIH99466.1 MAG: tryptophan synthase subunit alpha [candidate division NPL-UPA2 bacterium Unc8]